MPRLERLIAPVAERIGLVVNDAHRLRVLRREIRRNEEYGRSLERNPDGSMKSAAEIAAEAKRRVLEITKGPDNPSAPPGGIPDLTNLNK